MRCRTCPGSSSGSRVRPRCRRTCTPGSPTAWSPGQLLWQLTRARRVTAGRAENRARRLPNPGVSSTMISTNRWLTAIRPPASARDLWSMTISVVMPCASVRKNSRCEASLLSGPGSPQTTLSHPVIVAAESGDSHLRSQCQNADSKCHPNRSRCLRSPGHEYLQEDP